MIKKNFLKYILSQLYIIFLLITIPLLYIIILSEKDLILFFSKNYIDNFKIIIFNSINAIIVLNFLINQFLYLENFIIIMKVFKLTLTYFKKSFILYTFFILLKIFILFFSINFCIIFSFYFSYFKILDIKFTYFFIFNISLMITFLLTLIQFFFFLLYIHLNSNNKNIYIYLSNIFCYINSIPGFFLLNNIILLFFNEINQGYISFLNIALLLILFFFFINIIINFFIFKKYTIKSFFS